MSTQDKTTPIEEALAHQEQQIQDLSEIVTRQADEIDMLKKRMLRMNEKITVIEDTAQSEKGEGLSVTEQAARNKPPHY